MQIRTETKDHPIVSAPTITVDQFGLDTIPRIDDSTRRLQDNPDALVDIEHEVDAYYRKGGGQLLASLLVKVSQEPQRENPRR